ncbi:MAG: ABC transporter ATP-binding protein [Deltaproteobacteria bacterium]|nr:ABC transporter ATP-binding protein [Deltaproteobacteria bacterium]
MELILDNISCGYGKRVILQGFSAAIPTGQVFCLLGPNGIGKTTLFKAILGLLPLKAGRASLDQSDLRTLSRPKRARLMGYVPQSQFTPFAFSVLDVVLMGRTAHLGPWGRPGRVDYQVAEDSLARLGLEFLRDRYFTELSGGERQMVLIARALAQEPMFLMMDEPTSNLDFGNQAKTLRIIRQLADQGLGVVLTTHYPDHVFQCGDQAALLKPDGSQLVGPLRRVLTAENLSEAYGVPVAVLEWPDKRQDLTICRPVYD